MSKSRSSGRGNTDHLELIPYRPERSWPVQLLLMFWRWAIELMLLIDFLVLGAEIHSVSGWPVKVSLAVAVGVLAWLVTLLYVIPVTRPGVPGLFWCLVTRHRLRTFFLQARVFNRSARLPWIVMIRPTPVGERVWVWLVPGLSIDDFASSVEKLSAACWARTVRVERSRKVGALVRLDVVRRDPLMAVEHLPSVLIPTARRGDVHAAATVAAPLDIPRTVIDLTAPVEVTKKAGGLNRPVKAAPGKAALSNQDSPVIPSSPSVIARGGEDVSDYV